MSSKIYAAVGENGVVRTNNYYHAKYCLKYLRGLRFVKGFQTPAEADLYLREHLRLITPEYTKIPEDIPDGKIITVRRVVDGTYWDDLET